MSGQPPTTISAALLWRMVEASPSLMVVTSGANHRVVCANRTFRRLAGDEAGDPTGLPLADCLTNFDASALDEARIGGRPVRRAGQSVIPGPGEATTYWDFLISSVSGTGSGEEGVLVVAEDVTGVTLARIQAEAAHSARQQSEERLRAVLLQIPAAVFIIEGGDGRVSLTSHRVEQVLGPTMLDLEEARLSQRGWAVRADGTPYDIADYPSRRALWTGETVEAERMIFRRSDGRTVDLEMYAGPVRDASGAIVAAVAAAFDVTDRHKAAQALRDSEARLRLALDIGGLGTWEVDLATGVRQLDASVARVLGFPPQPMSLSAEDNAAHVHPDDLGPMRAALAAAVAGEAPFAYEFRGRGIDGRMLRFASRGRIIRDATGKPVRAVGVLRDITEQWQREERLREAIEARELLLREADHRIKNSLQLVASVLGLQRKGLRDRDAVAALDGAIARVHAIGRAHRALQESADLKRVAFGDMLRDLCGHAEQLNPHLKFVCACPAAFDLDTERAIPLGLIVSELLTNAAKHAYPIRPVATQAGKVGAVRVTAVRLDDTIEITVTDDGVGIGEEAREGGLGSIVVRSLAQQVGVDVTIVSAPGSGTAVTLRFASEASKAAA